MVAKTGEVWNPTKRQTRMFTRDRDGTHNHTASKPVTNIPDRGNGLRIETRANAAGKVYFAFGFMRGTMMMAWHTMN